MQVTRELESREEAAERLGVSSRTIRRWQEQGLLSRVPVGPRTSRVVVAEIDALVTRRGSLPGIPRIGGGSTPPANEAPPDIVSSAPIAAAGGRPR